MIGDGLNKGPVDGIGRYAGAGLPRLSKGRIHPLAFIQENRSTARRPPYCANSEARHRQYADTFGLSCRKQHNSFWEEGQGRNLAVVVALAEVYLHPRRGRYNYHR